MKTNENIIAIHKRDINSANAAFSEFMKLSEKEFNSRSKRDPRLYKNLSPYKLEEITRDLLKEVAPQTPFSPADIRLVSGHSFPDIMATDFYGVEVKSTKDDKWTSIGSSIVESTRNATVENIYMAFGKLGANPPEFRFRPYQECLSSIAVTHSPRYLIDMDLKEKNEKSIFEKINITYQDFSKNKDKIDLVRAYYIKQSQLDGKHEMPWWIGKKTLDTSDSTEVPSIKLFNLLGSEEKMNLKAQMIILFPKIILSDYADAALWLCTHRFLLCMNTRDFFSAGGQYNMLNGERLKTPLPAILKKLMDVMPYVKWNLYQNHELEYREFNTALYYSKDKLKTWLEQVKKIFNSYTYSHNKTQIRFSDLNVDICEFLMHPEKYVLGKI